MEFQWVPGECAGGTLRKNEEQKSGISILKQKPREC